jgi:protein N-terminal methyltransferase
MEKQSDPPSQPADADAAIDHKAAIEYWSSISADDNGVLGGYPQVSRVDLQGSANFLAKLRRKSRLHPISRRLGLVVDCGAGIGRITRGFLSKIADAVDIVEPVQKLTDVITKSDSFQDLRSEGRIGQVFNVGLEQWTPSTKYDLIWNQWCLGQLTDAQLVEYFARIKNMVTEGGWVVVKENMSTDPEHKDIFDDTDSSVTRSDRKFRDLFDQAGLKIVSTEMQRGLPKELFPVRTYALQAVANN